MVLGHTWLCPAQSQGMRVSLRDACVRNLLFSKGLRGTERPRPLRKMGSLSAPRLCGDILMPMPRRLTSVSARSALQPNGGVDLGFPAPGGRELGPLRLLTGARSEDRSFRPSAYARTSGAATLAPRSRRSAARVLMDEGWAECKRGLRGGDKLHRLPLVAGIHDLGRAVDLADLPGIVHCNIYVAVQWDGL
jgi:hypothetical protein